MIKRTPIERGGLVKEPEPKPWCNFRYGELFFLTCNDEYIFLRVDGGAIRLRTGSCIRRPLLTAYSSAELHGNIDMKTCLPVTGYAENIEIRSDVR